MGRKEQAATQQQETTQNNVNATNNANAQGGFNFLMPAYKQQYANPGFDETTKNNIRQATEGGIGAAYGAATQGLNNTAARTRNDAGVTATQDDLARQRMSQVASTTQGNEIAFADKAKQDQQAALSGAQGVYGTTQGAATGGGNTSAQLQSAYNNAAGTPWWQSLLGVAGQVGGAAVGAYGKNHF